MTRYPLDVWLYGTRIATLREHNAGRISLGWTEEAHDRWQDSRLLSAKLTVGYPPADPLVRAYLDGLLPEGNARVNQALAAGVTPDDTYGLIDVYGRDTPGATIFVPEGSPDPTRQGSYEQISDRDVAQRLANADAHQKVPPTGRTESSTLPGMVPKITLHREGDHWFACQDGAASTWILKRADSLDSATSDVVDTEAACLDLARRVGVTDIEAELVDFGDVRAIAVSRYDRVPGDPCGRVHQEDLAQALGLSTADPNRKFQWGSRTPSLKEAAAVLRLDGGNPDDLLRLVTFSLLVGNTDLHAKNISFVRLADGRAQLSPAYDIAMHLHHSRDNRRFALDINSQYAISDLTLTDVVAEAQTWAIPRRRAMRVVTELSHSLAEALAQIDRTAHPGVARKAWDMVETRIEAGRKELPAHRSAGDSGSRSPVRRGPRPAR